MIYKILKPSVKIPLWSTYSLQVVRPWKMDQRVDFVARKYNMSKGTNTDLNENHPKLSNSSSQKPALGFWGKGAWHPPPKGLKQMGKFLWDGREKGLPYLLSHFSKIKLRHPTGNLPIFFKPKVAIAKFIRKMQKSLVLWKVVWTPCLFSS